MSPPQDRSAVAQDALGEDEGDEIVDRLRRQVHRRGAYALQAAARIVLPVALTRLQGRVLLVDDEDADAGELFAKLVDDHAACRARADDDEAERLRRRCLANLRDQ